MATLATVAVRDNSTLANFKQWAQVISNFMSTLTWTQTTDTGQVNWGTIAAVPGTSSYVYELWKPSDGLTSFVLKIEYGTQSTAGRPAMRLSLGTGSDGAGNLTGFVTNLPVNPANNVAVTSTTTQFNCYLSGDSGRVCVAMWVNDTVNTGPIFFGVERSINSSGSYTSDYVTLLVSGSGNNTNNTFQQSVSFANGAGRAFGGNPAGSNNSQAGWCVAIDPGVATAIAFSATPLALVEPQLGLPGNKMTIAGAAYVNDVTEEATVVIPAANMPYGVSHTYIGFKNGNLNRIVGGSGSANQALLMRYD